MNLLQKQFLTQLDQFAPSDSIKQDASEQIEIVLSNIHIRRGREGAVIIDNSCTIATLFANSLHCSIPCNCAKLRICPK